MTTYDWLAALRPASLGLRLKKAGAQSVSPYNGAVQVCDYVAERWLFSVSLPAVPLRRAADVQAREVFLSLLAAGFNRVRLGPFLRGQVAPLGTLRGSPTLQSTVTRGATSLPITGTGTLLPGDFLGAGGQLFRVAAACASSSGVITVPVENRVRGTIASGSAVTWSSPFVECIMPAGDVTMLTRPAVAEALQVDFMEWWA